MFTISERNAVLQAKAGISERTVRGRIERAYLAASPDILAEGRRWYDAAQSVCSEIADTHHVQRTNVAAVMAQLSPRTQWARNVQGARDLYEMGHAPGHIGANVDRALTAMWSTDPLATVKGPKTNAFARNILGCTESVTVDVWALRTALGTKRTDHDNVIGRVGVYQAISECFQAVARKHGETASAMQAIVWIVERNGRHA